MNPDRPQSSMLVDLKDPIQVHLLTETALADSKEYVILSQEEVDDLKKQCQSLTQRINQTRANLAIQSKYRDAAISMSKLYSPARTESRRRSLLGGGNRHSGGENAKEAESERQASEKKCEELSNELWSLEKRLMEPQRRLLQHTAGILQLTHRESKKNTALSNNPAQAGLNGIPGSPESMYTYSNSRNSYYDDAANAGVRGYLEDADTYGALDEGIDTWTRAAGRQQDQPPLEIPPRSPVREQNKELMLETDRLKQENEELREEAEQLRQGSEQLRQEAERLRQERRDLAAQADATEDESTTRMRTIEDTEQRLESLNARLRDVIVQINPIANRGYSSPPPPSREQQQQQSNTDAAIDAQLEYLEQGLDKIEDDSETQAAELVKQAGEKIGQVNAQIRDILVGMEPEYPTPPDAGGMDEQVGYLQQALGAVEQQISRAAEMSNSGSAEKQKAEQVEAVLGGLWDIIQSGLADQARQREQRRQGAAGAESEDEDDAADADDFNPEEPYSLPAFSARVQWLYAQATTLREQKSVLQRQIQQQRELNSRSDADREREMRERDDEISAARKMLDGTAAETEGLRGELARAMAEVEAARAARLEDEKAASTRGAEAEGRLEDARREIEQSRIAVANLERAAQELEVRLGEAERETGSLASRLEEATAAQKAAEAAAEAKQAEVKAKEEELDQLNMMVVEIKTELTFAKAELDGAYGSRAERAAEAAAVTASAEVEKLNQRVKQLEGELSSTLAELEDMTRETIGQEKEKLELEGRLDEAASGKAELESDIRALRDRFDREVSESRERITRLQEELDAERLKAKPGVTAAKPGAGASMLSEQFRATMREERRKFQEDLRREVAERRKLEDELRVLRKQAGPGRGRSPLTPNATR